MIRYTITNLLTGGEWEHKGDADSLAAYIEDNSQVLPKVSCGFPERRISAVSEPEIVPAWSIAEEDGELVHVTEGYEIEVDGATMVIEEIRKPLRELWATYYTAAGDPTLDGAEVVIPAQHSIVEEDMAPELEEQRIAKLWAQADKLAHDAFDHNSRAKALSWKVDGLPQWRADRIAAIDSWMDSVWSAFYAAKANPSVTTLPDLGPCPYTFADLLSE